MPFRKGLIRIIPDRSMKSVTELPLHGGKAPKWLFHRMVRLGRAISYVTMDDFGSDELMRRLSDSNWFQALSCAMGYDWHSSGTTTVTMGALKEALNDSGEVFIAGGKGKAGIKTPQDIKEGVDRLSIPGMADEFIEKSRLSAKIDSAMVYEDAGIYHHSFVFSRRKKWVVIQQAMSAKNKKAIRFQWLSDYVNEKDISNEPHAGISSDLRLKTLDLTCEANAWAHPASIDALHEVSGRNPGIFKYPSRHQIYPEVDIGKRGADAISKAAEADPSDYEDLLLVKGVGRATLRSLAFIASLIYDKDLSYRDPVTYSYALGGKDGIPFPINQKAYDSVIESMEHLIDAANIERGEKYLALKRLSNSLK